MWALRAIGSLYVISAAWCIFQLELSSAALGFQLMDDPARVEYLSVYGGLQLGLGSAMLLASFKSNMLISSVFFSFVFSSILFLTRLLGVVLYSANDLMLVLLCLEGFIALVLAYQWYQLTLNDK